MNDRYLIDLFGDLEFGTFEDDFIEKDILSFREKVKNKVVRIGQAIRKNIKKVITITMGIFAVIAFGFSLFALISKKRKRVKVAM